MTFDGEASEWAPEGDIEPDGAFSYTDSAWDTVTAEVPQTVSIQLPKAPRGPRVAAMQSADPDFRICVHELARALEEYATKEPVPLYGGAIEFDTAAIQMFDLMRVERCGLKGV